MVNYLNTWLLQVRLWYQSMQCYISHDWLYCSDRPIKGVWRRQCQRCRKKQHRKDNPTDWSWFWRNGWK